MSEGPAGVRGAGLNVTLSVTGGRVRLVGAGVDVSAAHRGVGQGLRNALHDVRRERTGVAGLSVRDEDVAAGRDGASAGDRPGLVSLRRAGELLAESFLLEPVSTRLAELVRRAERDHVALRIALNVPGLSGLPWEALPEPVSGRPLALHPQVSVYRRVEVSAPSRWPGPLRIVVAIASPDSGGGPLLDYEHELRAVLQAVREARRSRAWVEVVPFATTTAIRAGLNVAGGVHVLHISAHGRPGVLLLEDEQGQAREVTAAQLLGEAVPNGLMPPVICLAACYTDAEGEAQGASFAAQLAQHGACAVVGTQTSVTDRYATLLFSRFYAELASNPYADVVQALSDARRAVQLGLMSATDRFGQRLAGMDEWGVVSLLAGGPQVPVIDPDVPLIPAPVVRTVGWSVFRTRPVGQFVGRRELQRRLPMVLDGGEHAALVLHGIGGIGKTTLAAEVLRRTTAADPEVRVAALYGPVSVDGVLAEVAAVARRELLTRGVVTGPQTLAVQAAARADVGWQDRFALLREHVLDDMAILVVLDNFEDNLVPARTGGHQGDGERDDRPGAELDGGGWQVADPALAELLSAWIASPGRSCLVVTSRYPVGWPRPVRGRIFVQPVGPLSAAETGKLLWSLPHLDRHTGADGDTERVWRLVGGHPRSLEFLDALLGQGAARFDDVTRRLAEAVTVRLGSDEAADWLVRERSLDTAVADVITLVADDVLLADHLDRLAEVPGAVQALAAISVYREPVPASALAFHIGHPTPAEARAAHTAAWQQAGVQMNALLRKYNFGSGHEDIVRALAPDGPLPASERATLRDLLEAFMSSPKPPTAIPGVDSVVRVLVNSSLVHQDPDNGTVFMHRWTATELHRHWVTSPAGPGLVHEAHRAAAAYWRWWVDAGLRDDKTAVHDLEEARHHLIAVGLWDEASAVTQHICERLHQWGAWDRETSLIHDTLRWLPADSPSRSGWTHDLGILAGARGDYAEAERHYQQALTSYDQREDVDGMARGYHQLGIVAELRGDYADAETHYRRALAIAEQRGDQELMALGYHQLGMLAQRRGDYAEAERGYRQALTIAEQRGDQDAVARGYQQLGNLAQFRGDYAEAERRYRQALNIAEQLGDQTLVAGGYHNLGVLAQERGNYAEAERGYQQALTISEQLGHYVGIIAGYNQLGILAQLQGDYAEAERRYHQSLAIAEQLGDQEAMAVSYHQLGVVAELMGDYAEAERRCQQALAISEQLGDQGGLAAGYHQLGMLAQRRGHYPEAERRYYQSLTIKEQLGDQDGLAGTYHQLGMLAQLQGDYAEAERRYHQSLTIKGRLGNQDGIASTLSQLGILHTDTARPAEAIAYHLHALNIRLAIGAHKVGIDLTRLHRLRAVHGERAFAQIARQVLDNETAYANLSALLEHLPSLGLLPSDSTPGQVLHISTLDVARVTDAGVPVPALCGKYWVPFDDPLLPTCPECEAIIDANLDFAAVDMDSQPDRTETIGRPLHGLYAEDRRHASGESAVDPLGGVGVADVVATAIHSALNSCIEKELLGTCAILLSLMEADAASNWNRINLYFPPRLGEAKRGLFPDPPLGTGGQLKGTSLTVSGARALRTAARISLQFNLSPMPAGVLLLGLVANLDSGACRALGIVNASEQDEMIRLIQEDLLQVHLGGLNLSDLDTP